MTYKQLAEKISSLDIERQNDEVTVFVRGVDEFYPVENQLLVADEYVDVLDKGHAYLRVWQILVFPLG